MSTPPLKPLPRLLSGLLLFLALLQAARGFHAVGTARFDGSGRFGSYLLEGVEAQLHGGSLLGIAAGLAALAVLYGQVSQRATFGAAAFGAAVSMGFFVAELSSR